jgi:magnesium transporter
MDRVVDDYGPVVAGLENDIDEIEDDVFYGSPTVSRRIYDLAREVILFHRATKPLVGTSRTRRSRRSPHGPRSCSRRRWSGRSTA